jgi:hypothetical protein
LSYDYGDPYHDEPLPTPGYDKEGFKLQKLGFEPTLYVNLAGVVLGGQDRQEVLRLASAFVTSTTTLRQDNDGIRFYRDPKNPYDQFAIQVWLATRMEHGRFTQHTMAGFIPRRVCTNCWKSLCPYCHGPLNFQPMSWINQYLCEKYFDVGKNIWYSVWWINQKDPRSNWGCQLGLGLPPIALTPPRS